jgi:hypothetical protein
VEEVVVKLIVIVVNHVEVGLVVVDVLTMV